MILKVKRPLSFSNKENKAKSWCSVSILEKQVIMVVKSPCLGDYYFQAAENLSNIKNLRVLS